MSKRFYITTTLPYVNAEPHIGFALEIVQADVLARYHRRKGDEVFFNTGTDEHGLKIYRKALEEGMEPQAYCDQHAAKFDELKQALNLSYNNFIRTTDDQHIQAAQEFWRRCDANGDIYKKQYKITYCVGCELEKTKSELIDDQCPLHPNLELETIEEENYFFRYSKYQAQLLQLYEEIPNFVVPKHRLNEICQFTKQGLEDFSISRLKSKMPWGVPVPTDEEHVMYVWFDALVNYISALGWPDDQEQFSAYWPGTQVAGKDNLRQQSSMWQAMLLSAGLPPSKQIFIHGFITVDGQKISKSLGNVIDPFRIVQQYGTDAVRYYLLREIPTDGDGDWSEQKFKTRYNAFLAHGLGNVVARVLTLIETNQGQLKVKPDYRQLQSNLLVRQADFEIDTVWQRYQQHLDVLELDQAIGEIWRLLADCDALIEQEKPWQLAKDNSEKLSEVLYVLAETIRHVGWMLYPIMPQTAQIVLQSLGVFELEEAQDFATITTWGGLKDFSAIKRPEVMFPRL